MKKFLVFFFILISSRAYSQSYALEIETNLGTMIVVLYDDVPKHTANYVNLANNGTLDSTLFHRVIENFMIQGGDPESKRAETGKMLGNGDLGYLIDAEIDPDKHFHKKGVIAAARDDIPSKASSACQFYIVQGKVFTDGKLDTLEQKKNMIIPEWRRQVYRTLGGTPHLDGNYTVFGELIEGMDVLDRIAAVDTDENDRPRVDVRIFKVRVVKVKREWKRKIKGC
jgi:peptidyl-prolyl cis-trans isomerase B (cyclophilin B)